MKWNEPAAFSHEQWKECRDRIDDARLAHLTIRDPNTGEYWTYSGLVSKETAGKLVDAYIFAGPDMQGELDLG